MIKLSTYVVVLLVLLLAVVATARADFRTDNSWETTPQKAVNSMVHEGYWFTGGQLGSNRHRVRWAKCSGDNSGDYAYESARGWYHHLFCGALVFGSPHVGVTFELWQLGPKLKNYRVTNIDMLRV